MPRVSATPASWCWSGQAGCSRAGSLVSASAHLDLAWSTLAGLSHGWRRGARRCGLTSQRIAPRTRAPRCLSRRHACGLVAHVGAHGTGARDVPVAPHEDPGARTAREPRRRLKILTDASPMPSVLQKREGLGYAARSTPSTFQLRRPGRGRGRRPACQQSVIHALLIAAREVPTSARR